MKRLIWILLALSAAAATADDTVYETQWFRVMEPEEAEARAAELIFDAFDHTDLVFNDEEGERVKLRFNIENRVIQVIADDGWSIENVEEFTLPGLFRDQR